MEQEIYVLLVVVMFLHCLYNSKVLALSNEHRLLRRVFEIYGDGCEECKLARPIFRDSDTMLIEFGIALIQVVELDEKRQMMTTHIWEYHVWHDHRLAWNASEYGGLQSVNPHKSKIWNPSITLYNVIEKQMPYDHPLNVWDTGEVLWVTQAIYKSPCDVKTYNFPFDVHQCNFTFAPWTHSEAQLNLTFYSNQDKILMMSYYNNPQWEIENIDMQRRLHYYQCCPEPFVQLIYSFTLRRRVAFFAFVLILPSILLSMLTLVVFCLPHDSTDKINIGLSIFLSYFLLLMILVESTPTSGTSIPPMGLSIFLSYFVLLMILVESTPTSGQAIPLMGQYFCVSLVIIAMSVITSTFIINIYGKKSKRPLFSKKHRRIVLVLAKYLLVQGPWFSKEKQRKEKQRASIKQYATNHWADTNCNEPLSKCNTEQNNHYEKLSNNISVHTHASSGGGGGPIGSAAENDLSDSEDIMNESPFNRERGSFRMALRRGLGDSQAQLNGRISDPGEKAPHNCHATVQAQLKNSDWALLASLLDRVFFLIYFTVNVIAASVIFTRAIP